MSAISEIYRQALVCIANWPDGYEEVVFPEVSSFAGYINKESSKNAAHVVQLAQAAGLGHKAQYKELLDILEEWANKQ